MTYHLATDHHLYYSLQRYRLKRDIPKDRRQFNAIPVVFGLWGVWWIARGPSGLYCQDGQQMPFHVCRPLQGPPIIGPRDLTACDHHRPEISAAWRESLVSDISARIGLPTE